MPAAYNYDEHEMSGARMSRVTVGVLNAADPAAIIHSRRANYATLAAGVRLVRGAEPLYPVLADGVCPLAFPLVVRDRNRWMRRLAQLGAHPTPWWSGYHPGLDFAAFPNACWLKDSLVALPVHQQLDQEDMDFLIDCVHEAAAGQNSS